MNNPNPPSAGHGSSQDPTITQLRPPSGSPSTVDIHPYSLDNPCDPGKKRPREEDPFAPYPAAHKPFRLLDGAIPRSSPIQSETADSSASPRAGRTSEDTILGTPSAGANKDYRFVTPPSREAKRPLSDGVSSRPSVQPLGKRACVGPTRKHTLDRFTFHDDPFHRPVQPPSPLFFSNSSHTRPVLPPRFSSSEAGAKMLSRAKNEDAQIKTVSLARGTVSTPSVPTSAQFRPPPDGSTAPGSQSPDHTNKNDTPLSILSSIGIVELLEQDERPTIIVDLGESGNYGPGSLHLLFANSALRSYHGLVELVTGVQEGETQDATHSSYLQFKAWLLSASVNGESLNVCLPSFKFASMSWSCSTLRKRLRIVSGAFMVDAPSATPKSTIGQLNSTPGKLTPASDSMTLAVRPNSTTATEEPQDYFGDASIVRPAGGYRKASRDVVPSIETPHSVDIFSHTPQAASRSLTATASDHPTEEAPFFDWTRLPITESMPRHIRFARSIDWASTALGPIEHWSPDLRQMCNLIMASPHPAAMYWGDDLIAIYNEAYILLAGQKHPTLMGQSYSEAWAEIWDDVREVFANAKLTGEATMKDDDCLFIKRVGYLEETYFSWSIIPMVGSDGSVTGLYNPAFEKTRRKIAERRMLTLREIGERTAAARDVTGFWEQVLGALQLNEYDTPFVLLYSVTDEQDSDASSIHSSSIAGALQCTLEGSLGVPEGHPSAPAIIDFKTGVEGFGPVFREVITTNRPVLLEVDSRDLPASLLQGMEKRGFGDPCRAVVICPIHPTTGESILGFLVLGVNPRRPYDEDYSLFVQLLSRQLATSLASVVLFEEEIRRGQRAAKLAALDRIELSEQLAARTQEAIESETKFTRMAEFAPVGMFIANSEGKITYCNDTWFEVSRVPRDREGLADQWMDAVQDEDRASVVSLWHDLVANKKPITGTFRFKAPWKDNDGSVGERWVLFSAYPEKYENGKLKSVFGSFTDISQQKWAEGFQKRKMEEAVELKRQQENFIDMTSHEMRNPLSAILQCADEISTTMGKLRDDHLLTDNASEAEEWAKVAPKLLAALQETVGSSLEAAQTIALCAQHQKRIVDDILTLSKLDSQLLLVTPVDAQPLSVVQRALKMHEGELHSNDIQLKFVVEDSFHKMKIDWVRFDPSRVLQVLINLTTNAIKFTTTERKRTITVSIAASHERPAAASKRLVDYFPSRRPERAGMFSDKDWGDGEEVFIHFAVQDTGRGLTAEEKKMLFLRFSQASPRTHVQYGGSGLGLFISRELTELQGGEIGVASEAGKGSTFAFYVKARRTTGPKPDQSPTAAGDQVPSMRGNKAVAGTGTTADERSRTAKKSEKTKQIMHILVVEDNLVNQRVLQKQLKNLGCIVNVANHGGEALEHLRKSTYWANAENRGKPVNLSVVLMDQEMPVMDGITCTRKIRELEREGQLVRHVPIIAVTANARSEQIQTAMDAGMDGVVSKPFRIPDLIPKIEELMEKYPEP